LSNWAGIPDVRIKFVMIDNAASGCGINNRGSGWTIDEIRIGEDTTIQSYIKKSAGDGQTGQVGMALSNPFTALVHDPDNRPRPGIVVDFTVTGGGGTLSKTTVTTGTDGKASTILTLGVTPGANTVTATVKDSNPIQSVTFTATGYEVGQAMRLEKISGDNQTNTVGLSLPNPFVVKVTDVLGNPVTGVNVNFARVSGDPSASFATASPVPTDTAGYAKNRLILGPNTGEVVVSASASGLIGSPVTFKAYAVLQGGTFGDTDGDGMPDDWEVRYGLNPTDGNDASLDKDNDGLTNLEEYSRGTDPTKADTDMDGMPDGWEVRYGLNPLDPSDAGKDANNDGKTNLKHYQDGTVPIIQRHFTLGSVTGESMDFYGTFTINGMAANIGDEVAAICKGNIVCGQYTVTTPGQYGFMHVYKTEGMATGDAITFKAYRASTGIEMLATATVISGSNPPAWMGDRQVANVNLNGAEEQRIPLKKGWNLISFSVKNCYYTTPTPPAEPMLPGTTYIKVASIAQVLSSIDGKCDVVRSFDGEGAHTFDPLLPDYSDMKYMAGGYGYWIKMKEDGELKISGTRAVSLDTLPLRSGWNLIGYWAEDIRYMGSKPTVSFPPDATKYTLLSDMGDAFMSIANKYSIVRSFDTGFHTYDPYLPGFNDLTYIGPGYGMWIKMKTPGNLKYE
ncbi:MAG: hypothetical protein N2745_11620, partial [Syntrophorhabdaceae bacterium]|nr:hypothetical protein [Syntrophorhabdaceae bacterium]